MLGDSDEFADLVTRHHRLALEGQWATTMRFYAASILLVIDELGCLPLPGRGCASLHQVVARRYTKTSIVMTTNCGVGLCAKFGDNTVAAAMLDRLPHCSACSTSAASFTGCEITTPDWRNSATPPSEPATHYSEIRS